MSKGGSPFTLTGAASSFGTSFEAAGMDMRFKSASAVATIPAFSRNVCLTQTEIDSPADCATELI